MKYFKLTLTVSVCALLGIFSSCKKDTTLEKPLPSLEIGSKRSASDGQVLFKLSDKSIEENRRAYIAMVSKNLRGNSSHNTQRGGYCSPVSNVQNTLFAVYRPGCGGSISDSVELTYLCSFISDQIEGAMTYKFKLSSTLMATYAPISAGLVSQQQIWVVSTSSDNALSTEYAVTMHTYKVVFKVADYEYTVSGGTSNTLITTCMGNTEEYKQQVSLNWPPSYYTNAPAEVYIFTGSRRFHVSGPCTTILCIIPHLACPSSSTFKYRLQGTSTWATTGVPSTVTDIPSGWYEYECQHHYSFGSSQVASGLFFVNP